jgi:hypothetical protein
MTRHRVMKRDNIKLLFSILSLMTRHRVMKRDYIKLLFSILSLMTRQCRHRVIREDRARFVVPLHFIAVEFYIWNSPEVHYQYINGI